MAALQTPRHDNAVEPGAMIALMKLGQMDNGRKLKNRYSFLSFLKPFINGQGLLPEL